MEENASPDPLGSNIEAVTALHARAERQVGRHQRLVEKITALLGRPGFFFGILAVVALWIGTNLLLPRFGLHRWDEPPFFWLDTALSVSSVIITTVVLITQNRQEKLAERREHLDLQMSLLAEQRTAKIIELLEELRRDLPHVKNRVDAEAEALQESMDPHVVLTALEFKMEQAELDLEEVGEAAARTEVSVREALQAAEKLP